MTVTIKHSDSMRGSLEVAIWSPNKTYKKGDVILRCGHLYECRLDHTSSVSFKDDSLSNQAWIWFAKMMP